MEKIYYHRIPGARFIMPDGTDVRFSADDGAHRTEREDVQKELDKIANVPTSQVYTRVEVAEVMAAEADVPVKENLAKGEAGFDNLNRTPPGTKTEPIAMQKDVKPNLTAGNADPDLQTKLAAAKAAVASSGSGGAAAPSNSK